MALSKCMRCNQVLTFEWRNSLLYYLLCLQKLLLKRCFLIKAPYLGKLSVMYDAENVGLKSFSSDENKGLQQ